ncbi:nucleoside recognition domain-containing protein [Paenibacillaceae bacterium WGS1546]|uniref:nucleoside recognition domain-containing protein n=1 Tax=Cohnella sp. WGS1546 TaxID=3366810 RepID=UPI00372D1866
MKFVRSGLGRTNRRSVPIGAFVIGGASLWIGGLALANGQVALSASLRGIAVWWEVLFPALFPFFVLSELLLGFGIVHLAGTLLDPFMRPLFRLPGVGAFVVSMGFVSGYPVGARLTSRLAEQKLVTRNQGERLVAMTTTSDPIFLIGAVSIGFFGSLQTAPALAVAHYAGALLLGLASRFGATAAFPAAASAADPEPVHRGGRLRAALAAMHRARLADGRPFGVLLLESLQSSLKLMMIVGGLVVFFSAALDLLLNGGILSPLRHAAAALLQLFGLAPELSSAYMNGAFEVTLGAKASAENAALPLADRVAVAAFVLSWAGLSVHAQVAGLMSGTDWRYLPFARARLLHGVVAMILVYALWPILGPESRITGSWLLMSAWLPTIEAEAGPSLERAWIVGAAGLPLLFGAIIAFIVVAGTLAALLGRLKRKLR